MKSFRLYLYNLAARVLPETRCFALKARLLRWCGATIGRHVRVCSSAVILGDGTLSVGDDTWIGPRVHLSPVGKASISIGASCDIAPMAAILTGSHDIAPVGAHIAGNGTQASVTIGDGSWIGARATLLPGVSLPAQTVVAAGALVTPRSADALPPRALLAGVPASHRKTYSAPPFRIERPNS